MLGLLRTTAVVIGAGGAMAGAAYGMLQQGRRARRTLAIPGWFPFRADGVYLPDGTGPLPPSTPGGDVLNLVMIGDSSAAGLGVDQPDELPGVVLARGLAEEAGCPVRLDTLAVCGCTSRGLSSQVDVALTGPPHAALIMIGANDVTQRMPPRESAALVGEAVTRLRAVGTAVVVGTCPDLGVVRAIPQPLRAIARTWSLAVARLQRDAVLRAGGLPVPIADLLALEFFTQPRLFSRDHFHPSTAGYDAACSVLLPALCSALGVWGGGPVPLSAVHAMVPVDQPAPRRTSADPATAPSTLASCRRSTRAAHTTASDRSTASPGTLAARSITALAACTAFTVGTAGDWSNRVVAALDRGVRRARGRTLGLRSLGLRPDRRPATGVR